MGELLDHTVQGDVGTLADEARLPAIKLMTPLELYRLWERQNWSSHQISLERDRRDWEAMDARERETMLYGLSAFFVGEERVTAEFSGLVMAAEDKHEEAFLLTQQVDEARHAQHFNRLYEEVFGWEGEFEARVAQARGHLTERYFELFDRQLGEAHRALLADLGSLEAKVDFVVIYHMVIEGSLALTGQYFQTARMERRGVLPGHLEAFRLIARDEHRHVAYGTWFLQQKARDPALAARIQTRLADLLPTLDGVLTPPGYTPGEEYEHLGYTSAERRNFAFTALSRRLRAIGVQQPVPATPA